MRIIAQVHLQPTEHIGEAIKKLNRMGLFFDSKEFIDGDRVLICSRTIDLNQTDPYQVDLEGSDANPSIR